MFLQTRCFYKPGAININAMTKFVLFLAALYSY